MLLPEILKLEKFIRDNDGSDDSSTVVTGDDIERQDGAEGLSLCYLKREAYFCKCDMVAKQLNTSLPHVSCAGPDKEPKSCI